MFVLSALSALPVLSASSVLVGLARIMFSNVLLAFCMCLLSVLLVLSDVCLFCLGLSVFVRFYMFCVLYASNVLSALSGLSVLPASSAHVGLARCVF